MCELRKMKNISCVRQLKIKSHKKGVCPMKIVRCFLPVLFIASAAAFVLTGCTKTVDLLQYANVSITGESGDAEANIMIDESAAASL